MIVPIVGFNAAPVCDVPEKFALPVAYPVLVVVTVTVELVPGFNPVTVTKPVAFIFAMPPFVADAEYV